MARRTERTTVYLDVDLHRALRMKAAVSHRPVSDIINQAVRDLLRDDREDLDAFERRAAEPEVSYEQLLAELKAHGVL